MKKAPKGFQLFASLLGKISLLEGLWSVGAGCPGQRWSPHPWRGSENRVDVALRDVVWQQLGWWLESMTLEVFSNLNDSTILWSLASAPLWDALLLSLSPRTFPYHCDIFPALRCYSWELGRSQLVPWNSPKREVGLLKVLPELPSPGALGSQWARVKEAAGPSPQRPRAGDSPCSAFAKPTSISPMANDVDKAGRS